MFHLVDLYDKVNLSMPLIIYMFV